MGKEIQVWSDGACRGNGQENSVGGCGVVLICNSNRRELKSACYNTTNNAQEIKAAILGLEALKQFNLPVTVYSDSAYVVNCFVNGWYKGWKAKGWITSKGTPVLNKPLWVELIHLVARFDDITFEHVKGHAGIGENDRCDQLANIAIEELLALGSDC